ncbi:MAG TPA: WD40 repeat domain-containing protein, partial [Herpetosiphonaceae bacterium]|nr:WD40 repeat domain-containing protein [Herpetosiphonaceae bacterium]
MTRHRHIARWIRTGLLLSIGLLLASCAMSAPPPAATPSPAPPPVPPEALISAATAEDVRELARLESTRLDLVEWMPDGRSLVVGGGGTIGIYDSAALTRRRDWRSSRSLKELEVAPNGRLVAGTQLDHVVVWSSADGSVVAELDAPHIETALAFAPDGARLIGAGRDQLWEWSTQTWELSRTTVLEPQGPPTGLGFSRDGALLAVSFQECQTQVFNADQVTRLVTLGTRCTNVNGPNRTAFSADATVLAMANPWQPVSLWNIGDGSLVRYLGDEAPSMSVLDFAPGGPLLATASQADQPEARLWDSATGVVSATLHASGGPINDLALSPQG